MLNFILLSSFMFVKSDKSPHGEEYIASLTPIKKGNIGADVLEDSLLDVIGLIRKHGYVVESHEIKTEDGYILTAHRIPRGKINDTQISRTPVLLMHGLMSSSADWITNGPQKSLGYILADRGYDVWLANARGNYYSRRHVTLSPRDSKFWSFSWHEIGYFDIPAFIDHILVITGRNKLHFIGHSQGTTTFFVLGSTKPEYNNKIMSMYALAPIAFMDNIRNKAVKILFDNFDNFDFILEVLLQNDEDSHSLSIFSIYNELCTNGSEFYENCLDFYNNINGQINMTKLPVYLSHFPAGCSVNQIKHYAQLYKSRKFQQFDWGSVSNEGVYGAAVPPEYALGKVSAPVVLYYATDDDLADCTDVHKLSIQLNNTIDLIKVSLDTFTHVNFLISNDAKKLLYDNILLKMKSFE